MNRYIEGVFAFCGGAFPFATGFALRLSYNKQVFKEGEMAMTVVYADSVFFLNTLMDYLLFLSTARLAGIPLRRRRYVLAALLGGIYAVACFFPQMGFLSQTPVKAAVGGLLALIAFGGEERLLRLTVLLFAVSCAMAGCVLGLGLLSGGTVPAANGIFYTDVSFRVLLIATTAAYLTLAVVFRAAVSHGVEGKRLPVELSIHGRTMDLTALYDSGNSLRDPVSGEGVLVLSCGAADAVLPREVRALLTPQALHDPAQLLLPLRKTAPQLAPQLLPYQAVGTGSGLLLAVRTDYIKIGGAVYQGALAALSPTRMEAAALWGGTVRKGGTDDHAFGAAKTFDEARPSDTPGGPLYRGQRHAAPAPLTGAGSGAFGASGGGRGPQGAHRT